ncbi:MAG: chromosome segregation protein SMC [Burkholderiales bacterium]|nr:chromosome segregation protein SMC [Burkholderiales bacterium]
MRLNSIKLSGFKSFAEPTNFLLPGQLVGVVGPNGCGKSNIMDAVRWVLGESRASELRGDSMQDVIFNGTTSRKAASRSSVELVFDNSDYRAGGQWSQFTEIAVKRILTRDGTSSYYINNQPVRRRDVQDVFLGTGLGPRAYAIIGQGTISRIIESKPEELRLFLEEAAGVSKYKERRRETENRLSDTRENLTRVEDILRELTTNLEKLEKQAEVAQKFNALQSDVKLKQQQLWFLKRTDAEVDQTNIKTQVDKSVNELESRIADLRHIESDLETIRQAHYAAGDQVNQFQGALYEASAEVARLEAEIRFVVEGRQRAQLRLEQMKEQILQWTQQSEQATLEISQLSNKLEETDLQTLALHQQIEEIQISLPEQDANLKLAQSRASDQRNAVSLVQQRIQVLAAEQRSMEEQSRQLVSRKERLSNDQRSLAEPDIQKTEQLKAQLQDAQITAHEKDSQLDVLELQVPELDQARTQAQERVNAEQSQHADLSARSQALLALQSKLQTNEKLKPWLASHGLDGLQALWQRIHVQTGWENALEAAMRERLSAFEISKLEMVSGFASDAPPTKLTFFSPSSSSLESPTADLQSLSDLLQLHDVGLKALMIEWLQDCFVASDLTQALTKRHLLKPGQVLYVPQGHAVTAHSVSFYAQDNEQAGLLARAQEIENLEKRLKAQVLICEDTRQNLFRSEHAYREVTQSLTNIRLESTSAQARVHELEVELIRLTQIAEQTITRGNQIDQDLEEVDAQLLELNNRKMKSEEDFETLDMQLAQAQERHAQLDEVVIQAQQTLNSLGEQLRQLERQAQEADFAKRSLSTREAELNRIIETAHQQTTSIKEDEKIVLEDLSRLSDVSAQSSLQAALHVRIEREASLASKRSEYDDLTAKLRASDEHRLRLERELDPIRQRITDLQLKEQAARLGFEQYHQLLLDNAADLEVIAASIAENSVRLSGLQSEIDRLLREMNALGPVNMAALDELAAASERKIFLDAQSSDLNEAMTTLQDAIRKIDAETRALLEETFNNVNLHFGKMFPELFGGGNARLVMTGEEILDSGVQVMAQPPGKKNQSINLLSGGEKALTALALVFAIFQLNPAPFCLLDEVDAPLDDSNTERFAKLLITMSKGTQFLFISHNKITMQMAEQLIGVTMQEQGVSRIVAVDMESAISMIDTV